MADQDRGAGGGEPLAASVGEQLREKAHLDEVAAAERATQEQRGQAVARRKDEERRVAAAHGGEPQTWPARRRAAHDAPTRRGPGLGSLLAVVGGVALLTRLLGRRRG